ncbi:M56 family metallopeptidase [Williamsia sp. DF01-3]|uniref:M56 family metallopeptidase n=1 Tax=Williamsia sp. DF01-3 TaxID=2934157 RepID=UPI001FF51B1F|nr:M56 family metallopeptidase [Williamsia sp. DF01-3]MCK0515899.1 M56 family metallopeptidase [Williamsia sp. DF01-3]
MTLALAAALIGVTMPRLLTFHQTTASPRLMIICWLASIAAFVFLALSAVVVAAWPDHAPAENVTDIWIRCLSSAQHTMSPWVSEIALGAASFVAVFLSGKFTAAGRRLHRSRMKVRNYHDDVLTVIARIKPDPDSRYPVLWLDHPLPFAYSIAGSPGLVIATEGLNTFLTPTEAAAVLEHERAHLHSRHHDILAICAVLARTAPIVPLFSRAPAAISILVELDADRVAARKTSPANVHSALCRVLEVQGGEPSVEAMGYTSTAPDLKTTNDRRLHVLSAATLPTPHHLIYAAAALLPLATAAISAIVAMATLSAAYCFFAS